MLKSVVKLIIVFGVQGLFLHACDAGYSDTGDVVSATVASKTQNDAVPARLITVYLKPRQDLGYIPLFDGRVVVAESVSMVPVTMAKGTVVTAGVDVVHIGASCQMLQETYPAMRDCVEEETAEFQYGAVESTAITDADGFAQLYVSGSERYRLRVKSWATDEDGMQSVSGVVRKLLIQRSARLLCRCLFSANETASLRMIPSPKALGLN